jgi:fibro-slime domain-containing protein
MACGDSASDDGEGGAGGAPGVTTSPSSTSTEGSGGTTGSLVTAASSSSGDQGGGGSSSEGCGDGALQLGAGEVCDDGNSDPGDGCAADCKSVDQGFACPTPGEPCVSTVVCGNGVITGEETCDDGDDVGGDGCSAECQLEAGWTCALPNVPCFAAACGDGILAGNEQCEDGGDPPVPGDGCSDTCRVESGWVCDVVGQPCRVTVCNDGVREGDEPCDDGNSVIGDGCSPFCQVEPNCDGVGACISACGDGLILPGDDEDCDDGNTNDGDGCSALCEVELGWACAEVQGELPPVLEVPVVYRDVVALPTGGSTRHPDFEIFSGSDPTPGMVENLLGPDGKPVYTGICDAALGGPCPFGQQSTTQENYDQWYRTTDGVNIERVTTIALTQQPDETYYFPDASFFPMDAQGWVAAGLELTAEGHNFGFTSEIRTWFQFNGGESLNFSGDDDVWVFINAQLALDLGGLHPPRAGAFVLDEATALGLGLEAGNVYEIALFHAERHSTGSNFNLTLGGFVSAPSVCETDCGDGIVAGEETCDDGVNDGSYGSCTPACTPGPFCGDAVLQEEEEVCDDGVNLSTYNPGGEPGCAPGCVLGAYCGDEQVDSLFGEECDDGENEGGYGGCDVDCTLGPRCGDGTRQSGDGEECDDGNTVSGDGCNAECKGEGPN